MSDSGIFLLVNGRAYELIWRTEGSCLGCDLSDVQRGARGGCREITSVIVSRDRSCTTLREALGFNKYSIFKEVITDET